MSEPKFTPGPWEIYFADKTKILHREKTLNLEMFVADVWNPCNPFAGQVEANAALIAVAPEMYEKLEWIMNQFNNSHDEELVAIGWGIQDLLKKARGEK